MSEITNPSGPSQDGDQQACVCDPHSNKWKSSNNNSVVHEGCQRMDREEKFTSASSELYSDRMEDTDSSAAEKNLSDRLIPAGRGDGLEEHVTRPMWDSTLKKKQTGFIETKTQNEFFETLKDVLETPCSFSKSLLVAVSMNWHHINSDDDRCCDTDKDKNNPCKSSKEFGSRRMTTNVKESGKRIRLTEIRLWQSVDEDGRSSPFGTVSSGRKDPNDEKANEADIWIRLDWVSELITLITEEMKRDRGDRSSTKRETLVAREEENSSPETTEDTEFVDMTLDQSSSEPRPFPFKQEPDVTLDICHHEALMTVTSAEDSFSHPNPTLNAMETQVSSVGHDCCGSSETYIADTHPTTSSSSEPRVIASSTVICQNGAVCNSSENSDREQPAEGKSRRHGIFRLFSSFIFQCWSDRRARKTRPDEYNRSAK